MLRVALAVAAYDTLDDPVLGELLRRKRLDLSLKKLR